MFCYLVHAQEPKDSIVGRRATRITVLHGSIRLNVSVDSTTKDIDHDQTKSISTKTAPSAKYDVHLTQLDTTK